MAFYHIDELIEGSIAMMLQHKRKLITPRFIMLTIANDVDIRDTLSAVTIPSCGAVPNVHPALLRSHTRPRVNSSSRLNPTYSATPRVNSDALLKQLTLVGGQTLKVVQSDLFRVKVQAIVHPTSSHFSFSGQIGSLLLSKGGTLLSNEMLAVNLQKPFLADDECYPSKAFNIPAKWIIHCNGPSWSNPDPVAALERTAKNVLELCQQLKLNSVAFPSIGSGHAGFPKEIAARTLLTAIKTYFDANAHQPLSLRNIYLVLYDSESVIIFRTELANLT